MDSRLEREEAEQIVEIQALLEHLRQGEQHPLDQIPTLPEGPGKKGENADGEHAGGAAVPDDGEVDDDDVPCSRVHEEIDRR